MDDWGSLKDEPCSVIGGVRSSEVVVYDFSDRRGHRSVWEETLIVRVVSCAEVGSEGEVGICDLGP